MARSFTFQLVPLLIRIRTSVVVGLGTLLTAILATGMRGDWLLIYVQVKRLWLGDTTRRTNLSLHSFSDIDNLTDHDPVRPWGHYVKDIGLYIFQSFAGAFLIFYGVGGYLKWYYYTQRRERAADWKCQPNRFSPPEEDRFGFWLGTINLAMGSLISGILIAYIMNGGETKLYYNIKDYGWVYFLLSIPILYLYNEAYSYYYHRTMHQPFFYRRIHKVHHRFQSPTPWSATAMHPFEFLIFQFLMEVPIFLVPLHAGVFLFWLIYGYYHSILSHSGVDLHSVFPWQPSVFFHDDHHRYFHCNFGLNTMMFDRLHGTLRQDKRFYSETIFGGKGAPIHDSSEVGLKNKYS